MAVLQTRQPSTLVAREVVPTLAAIQVGLSISRHLIFDLSGLTAYAGINVTDTGEGAWILTISHGCPGKPDYEKLTVSKTVTTSYTRTHNWSIAKSVDPSDIYLYMPGQGANKPSQATATWTVDVTYEGYTDSDWNVSGTITIKNTGTLDAVITGVEDVLAGTSISVNCGVGFPYTLPKGSTLTCTYSEDGYVTGSNVVTVTTERATYSDEKPIVWGAPTKEINKTVTIKDNGTELGTATAPNDAQFSYTKTFEWGDYGEANCGDHTYANTASVISDNGEVLASATATLTVHVQCYVYETAYGQGSGSICFIPTFSNWGWTTPIAPGSTTVLDLWAGAGQCDTGKGTPVGSVEVTYYNGYVTAYYSVSSPHIIKETHFYAGTTPFPKFGKSYTVAPGQYTNKGPFSGTVYVIAHAKVGIPDPNFP